MFTLAHLQLLSWYFFVLFACYLFSVLLRFGSQEKHLPPGQPTYPIIGNAHLLSSGNLYLRLKELSDKYGSIFSLKVGKTTIIVLNDPRAVFELIHKKSSFYMDRSVDQHWDLAYQNENLALMHSNDTYKAMRKIVQQFLSPKNLDADLSTIQDAEINYLMLDLLEKPEDFNDSIKRTSASIISIILYGFRATDSKSFWANSVYETMIRVQMNRTITPGEYLPITNFPFLKFIPDPFVPSKGFAKQTYRETTDTFAHARTLVEVRRKSGRIRDSLLDRLLDGAIRSDVPLTYAQVNSGVLGATYQGGSETSTAHTLTNLLFLAQYPHYQDKARVELDRVCGAERMPRWSDFNKLPYINCIVKEGLRIRPVTPIGAPHCAKADAWYEGMLIPKGATIIMPTYALNFTYHDDPNTYNPNRYLQHPKLAVEYAAASDYNNRDHYTFGSGRRICVGIHLAERTLGRMIAQILWAFEIKQPIDEHGNQVDLDETAYTDGMVLSLKPFMVRLTPRSAKHAEIVMKAAEESKDFLRQWE